MNKYIVSGATGKVGQDLQLLIKKNDNYIEYSPEIKTDADYFIHLSSESNANTIDYEKVIDSNITYLKSCIDYCLENSIKNFVFFSALNIYNHQDILNIDESVDYYNCNNLYNLSKLFGEEMLKHCSLNVLVLRLPSILTTKQDSGVLYRIYDNLRSDKDISLTNANQLFNNFVSVDDIYNFLKMYNFKEKYNIVILAKKQTLTLEEIVLFMKEKLNSNSSIIKQDQKQSFFNLSIKKAIGLGYEPEDVKLSLNNWIDKRK